MIFLEKAKDYTHKSTLGYGRWWEEIGRKKFYKKSLKS
jgi:hypothetical protein